MANPEMAQKAYEALGKRLYPTGLNPIEPRGETACELLERLERAERLLLQQGEIVLKLPNRKKRGKRKSPDPRVVEIRELARMPRRPFHR